MDVNIQYEIAIDIIACLLFCVSENETCACLIELLHDWRQVRRTGKEKTKQTDRLR